MVTAGGISQTVLLVMLDGPDLVTEIGYRFCSLF